MSRPRIAGLLALLVVLGACGSSRGQTVNVGAQVTRAGPAASGTPATVGASATGASGDANAATAVAPVLQFTASRLGGGTVDGASFAGKPVAFWFWAPG